MVEDIELTAEEKATLALETQMEEGEQAEEADMVALEELENY